MQEVVYDDWGVVSEQEDMRTHETTFALNYTEIIADLIVTVQAMARKIEALEQKTMEGR